MKTIESFQVNHLALLRGLYVSRKDVHNGVTVTTFDLRMTIPNQELVMNTGAVHTIEHLGATFLRNSAQAQKVIYFGPMGCRTGFYLVMFGDLASADVYDLVVEMCEFIVHFDGKIPGATQIECGNYSDQDLPNAKLYVQQYLHDLTQYKILDYKQSERLCATNNSQE